MKIGDKRKISQAAETRKLSGESVLFSWSLCGNDPDFITNLP